MQTISSAIQAAHHILQPCLKRALVLVDATAGNGSDTLFLAEHSLPEAKVYAFDVQAEALAQAKELTLAYADKIHFLLAGHQCVDEYIKDDIDAAIFNLGYLPGGDHQMTTRAETTLAAVEKFLQKLSLQGCLIIVAYPGHSEGAREKELLSAWLEQLPSRQFTAGCYQLINHKAGAPLCYIIEKVRR